MLLLETLIKEDFGYRESGKWGHAETHDSLVVDKENSRWFWNSKGLHGNTFDYLVKVRGYSKEKATEYLKYSIEFSTDNSEDVFSSPYEALVDYLWIEGKKNRDYWYHRCLNDDIIDRYRLGYFNGWYTLPIYVNGQFKNFQCRRDIPEKTIRPWYRGVGPLLFNSGILKFINRVFITEGPVDAILLNQYGYPAISHTGGANGWNTAWVTYFDNIKDVIYVADNDAPGISGAQKVAKSLGEYKVKILRFHDKKEKYDAVDFFRDGGTKEEFEQRLSKDLKYIFEGI